MYAPVTSVVATACPPISATLLAVTVTPGSAALVSSVTFPRIAALATLCAAVGTATIGIARMDTARTTPQRGRNMSPPQVTAPTERSVGRHDRSAARPA